ncbi:MAG: hypothetical protein SFU98_18045 [Leptospiraceae bacterium]|nr:hypothetical protein [Leptospiraceae bacterium]
MKKNYTIYLSILLLVSCVSTNSIGLKQVSEFSDTYWDELAELVSGLPLSEKNQFRKIFESSRYKTYAKKIDTAWKLAEKNYVSIVRDWKKENLGNLESPNVCFYPLSGVDFINFYQFCETAPKFIMVGLQKPGFLTNPNNINEQELYRAYASIESIVFEIAGLNYSTSRRMENESKNPHFTGIAPVILIFAKRYGFKIHSLKQVIMNENGLIVESNDSIKGHQGVQIHMSKNGDEFARELNFFKIYLTNESFEKSTPEGNYLNAQGRLNIVLKSSEYILQLPEYEKFLRKLLIKTDRVVQDESGIPFNYYDEKEWERKVFGTYIGRIELKRTPKVPFQTDLDQEFKKGAGKLPFFYGYGVLKGKDKSNLLFLKRKALP